MDTVYNGCSVIRLHNNKWL